MSGRVAWGSSGYTIPGLSLAASPASLWGLVINGLEGSPEKGLVEGCCKAGEERPNPELLTLEWVAVKSGIWYLGGDRIEEKLGKGNENIKVVER